MSAKSRRARIKGVVIEEYGGSCECCGESDPRFLTIDHKSGVGYRAKSGNGKSKRADGTTGVWFWLAKNGFPKDEYRLFCFNCNSGSYINGGVCPHRDGYRGHRR